MSEPIRNAKIFQITPPPIEIDAATIGEQIACDNADKQALILVWWAESVAAFGKNESWHMQCRFIAEQMTDQQCADVRLMLDTLVDHLEAIPQERRAAALTDQIVEGVKTAIAQ